MSRKTSFTICVCLLSSVALLASCDAFRLSLSQRVIPLSSPVASLYQDEGPAKPRFVQELVRTKRHSVHELVRAQPHLVHDMGWPEIHETTRSQAKVESVNSSQLSAPPSARQGAARTHAAVDESLDVEHEMEVRNEFLVLCNELDKVKAIMLIPHAGSTS